MSDFLSVEELKEIGFQSFGDAVCISRKASIYGAEEIIIGSHVRIDDFAILSGKNVIGDYVHIAAYSALYGGTEGIFIDNFSNISSRVSIYSKNDDYSGMTMTNPMVAERYKNVESAPVKIGRHVIIGSTSVVLPGVLLAEGSAFGSFSFINHDSEAWSINAGIPFKKIKERNQNILNLEREIEL